MEDNEKKNQEYLDELMGGNTEHVVKNQKTTKPTSKTLEMTNDNTTPPSVEYSYIDVSKLPSSKFYKSGTKIAIRAAKVSEIQSYSVVDDKNFVDITEKMNELLARNVLFTHPDGKKGTYRDLKDADRMFIIFMIREMTFAGGHTLTKEVQCNHCSHEFSIPFRATAGLGGPATFELSTTDEKIDRFWNEDEHCYELLYKGTSWRLGAPTIGIQEDFYEQIKREVQDDKKPNIAFMKIVPFLLYDRNSITPEGIKAKMKEFTSLNDLILFNGLNAIVNGMTYGIKGLVMKCNECGEEVHTDFTFPGGASTIFEIPNILDSF